MLRLNQHLTKSPFSNDFSDPERGSLNYVGLLIMVTIIGKLQIFGTCATDRDTLFILKDFDYQGTSFCVILTVYVSSQF